LRLKSGVELHIDRTATLLASPDIADFSDCSFCKVAEETLPDWKHHGAASWDRRFGQGFVMRHTKGFKFNSTEIDVQ
jgi:hypothetical protein